MRRTLQTLAVVAACLYPRADTRAAATTPILVELFTSEGCSDCPPADGVLEQLIATQRIPGVEVVGLGQHVDYWDQLGWKDRFSSAALTNRQHVYGASFALESVYTPQMIVDGRAQFVGSDGNAARKAIERAIAAPHGFITIGVDSNAADAKKVALQVNVSNLPKAGRGERADIIVAITEDHLRTTVRSGENHGRTLTHAAVVRSMTTIGEAAADGPWSAHAEIAIAPDWQRDQLKIVAFVQERRGRAILASASAPLQNSRR